MAATMDKKIIEISSKISSLTDNLEDFLSADITSSQFTDPLKKFYDITKSIYGKDPTSEALPELVVSGFDDEQIWQQLELDNEPSIDNLLHGAAKVIANKKSCSFNSEQQTDSQINPKTKKSKKDSKKKQKQEKSENKTDTKDYENNESEKSKINDSELIDGEDDVDDDLDDLEQNLDEIDNDDKFLDFTGDSDDDLNFDFGPLGQTKDLDEELFKDVDIENDNKKTSNKKKKSVTFEDEVDIDRNVSDNKKKSKSKFKKSSLKTSIVDDKFFKLAELEEFLDIEDKKEERKMRKGKNEADDEDDDEDDEGIDMFGDIQSEDEGARYQDFFDPPDGEVDEKATRGDQSGTGDESFDSDDENEEGLNEDMENLRGNRDLLADSESEGEDVVDILGGKKGRDKSSFEVRQERLKKKISAMEDDMLAQKPWQLSGEISAGKRPENSLLQENLQFEHTTRLPPEITEETTKTLEEMIIQRIKDKAWDDVERKVKPTENPYEYKKRVTLDQEKSKLSLSQIYEQEYLKQQKTEEEEKPDPNHDDIKKMMQSLFIKLDALSNFHYTPKQASAEITIITNQPSISMEEVAPVSVSNEQMLAPEEVQNKVHHDVKGSTERTAADRMIERRQKKKHQRLRQKEKEQKERLVAKLNPGLGNKYSKEKALKNLENQSKSDQSGLTLLKDDSGNKSGFKSSKTFFTQLQEEVTADISRKRQNRNQSDKQQISSAKKYKL